MERAIRDYLRLVILVLLPSWLLAQPASTQQADSLNTPPKLFLNCTQECYQDFLKTKLAFFDFVRDQAQADIQVLIIGKQNAGGGQLYSLTFIGANHFQSLTDTLAFSTKQADAQATIQAALLEKLKQGLVRYVARTALSGQMKVEFNPGKAQAEETHAPDPWNYWVFNLQSNLSLDGESNRRSLKLNNSLEAKRISNQSRASLSAYHTLNRNQFQLQGKRVAVSFVTYGLDARYVKSLSEHWSAGAIYSFYHSFYANIQASHRLAPAIEYNVFPYSENIRRQLRLAYQAGYNPIWFMEETIYGRTQQAVAYHKLSLVVDVTQTWGNVNASLHASSFLSNFSRNRLRMDTQLTVRLAEGLSLTVSGSASLVNDQISLAKAEGSQDAFLLQARQLPTRFMYATQVGLSYTFGSINNSIVNVRLNQIE
jgi:hypothetical protein